MLASGRAGARPAKSGLNNASRNKQKSKMQRLALRKVHAPAAPLAPEPKTDASALPRPRALAPMAAPGMLQAQQPQPKPTPEPPGPRMLHTLDQGALHPGTWKAKQPGTVMEWNGTRPEMARVILRHFTRCLQTCCQHVPAEHQPPVARPYHWP